uniref:hypothetical protein n=1 Tax=Francisella tularensis TaxID=263 RepID=UPI0013EE4B96
MSSLVGAQLNDEKVAKADDFSYIDPIDGSVIPVKDLILVKSSAISIKLARACCVGILNLEESDSYFSKY